MNKLINNWDLYNLLCIYVFCCFFCHKDFYTLCFEMVIFWLFFWLCCFCCHSRAFSRRCIYVMFACACAWRHTCCCHCLAWCEEPEHHSRWLLDALREWLPLILSSCHCNYVAHATSTQTQLFFYVTWCKVKLFSPLQLFLSRSVRNDLDGFHSWFPAPVRWSLIWSAPSSWVSKVLNRNPYAKISAGGFVFCLSAILWRSEIFKAA